MAATRLLRFAIGAVPSVSAAICVATLVLWARASGASDNLRIGYTNSDARWLLRSAGSSLELFRIRGPVHWISLNASDSVHCVASNRVFAWNSFPASSSDVPAAWADLNGALGLFSDFTSGARPGDGGLVFYGDARLLFRMPYWLVLLAAAAPGTLCVAVRRLPRRRFPYVRCPVCGYDLRATPDRCPECGRAVGKLAYGQKTRPTRDCTKARKKGQERGSETV